MAQSGNGRRPGLWNARDSRIVERKKKKQLTIVAPPLRPEEPTPPVEV